MKPYYENMIDYWALRHDMGSHIAARCLAKPSEKIIFRLRFCGIHLIIGVRDHWSCGAVTYTKRHRTDGYVQTKMAKIECFLTDHYNQIYCFFASKPQH